MQQPQHIPVLSDEVISGLSPSEGKIYVDGTIGLGGHSEKILELLGSTGKLIGIDLDQSALEIAKERLKNYGDQVEFVHGNFANLDEILSERGISEVDGVLLDLGVSSLQLDTRERGFSFNLDGPVDMRMDRGQKLTAFDVVHSKRDSELQEIIRELGQEHDRDAEKIVRSIRFAIERDGPIESTHFLARMIRRAVPRRGKHRRTDPATPTFRALRMYVNNELESLKQGIDLAIEHLKPEGRLCVIAFHSIEDSAVYSKFREESSDCICPSYQEKCSCDHKPRIKLATRYAIHPEFEEVRANPRSRSASLRIAIKLDPDAIPEKTEDAEKS